MLLKVACFCATFCITPTALAILFRRENNSTLSAGLNTQSVANSSIIPFALSIVNTTGHDFSDLISAFYNQPCDDPSKLLKRAMSRTIEDCPDGLEFLWSRCAPATRSPQTWSKVCRVAQGAPEGQTLHWGECQDTEFCVDGKTRTVSATRTGDPVVRRTAFCVDITNFLSIAMHLNNEETGRAVQAGFHAEAGKQYSVEAILTSSDSRTLMQAQSMEIQAQTAETIGEVETWRTLNAGDSRCRYCATVGILSVPVGTQRIMAYVEVMPEVVGGLLYLASVAV